MTVQFMTLSVVVGVIAVAAAETAVLAADVADPGREPVDFAREILPILSNKCFVCHGPDTRKENDLRLDSFATATRDRGGYRAIDPDAPEKSEILARIHDAEDPMPPADAEKQLTADERSLIRAWILQGGEYARHWAFVPPKKPAVPAIDAAIRNEIDAFIGARLREKGVPFAAGTDRPTLARRAALVLTGLPPDPSELASFLADEREDAYERYVDELLASPQFGEHQARYWLDAVRYGDTHGLHLDNRRGIFPYRDWVVRAFNENLPLDDFITWQIAGDLLPDPTLQQRVATGYVRMNPTTSEGGVLPEEFQAKNNFDRTETLGTVFLGMTLTCARCHTHKYDPIPQTEYYRLLAFFNSTAESSLDGNAYEYGPVIRLPENPANWDDWERLERARDALLAKAARRLPADLSEIVAHAKTRAEWKSDAWRISNAVSVSEPAPADADWNEAEGLPGVGKQSLPAPDRALWISATLEVPGDRVLWLNASGGPNSRVFLNEEPIPVSDEGAIGSGRLIVPLRLKSGDNRLRIKMTGTKRAGPVEVSLQNPWEALAKKGQWAECDREDRLMMLAESEGPLADRSLQGEARSILLRIKTVPFEFTTSLVARDLSKPRETRLLRRGEYNLPDGDPLDPGILSVMGAFPEGAPENRLGLARWLTSRDHPLVSRVLVNRLWQRVFGDGLVRTPEDFGLQGEQPTHPLLLDWLAMELQDSGWDMKRMLRLMVSSRTFRQSSARRGDVSDPENRLWARGPGYRLDAEILRDVALWASGLLDPQMGGEGVKPYQPAGLWKAMAHPASNTKEYVRDRGKKLYRRSLYVYWKRTSPHPMMTLFDAPSREASCVRRSRTNTSLQSLGLLNETQRVEMARALAERLLLEAKSDNARLDLLFSLLACRPPVAAERSACLDLLNEMRARYSGDEAGDDALALLSAGDADRDPSLDVAEHAAWVQVTATVLASDVSILLY